MIALAASLLLFAAPAPKSVAQPVAIMPFKNLNDDSNLDWLKSGIAETMITDMKKSGRVEIVEREQIDKALGEVLLQNTKSTSDEATATKVGKLVGAKTIVIGSFQQAGKQIRINARFVDVETGKVLDTAKSTGSTSRIFALQDEVVDRLLGTPPATRPKRKDSDKTFEAYHLYAMALTVASDADKIGYLKRSIDLDPDFVYAKDELAALEIRLGGYQKLHDATVASNRDHYWSVINDTAASPQERVIASNGLLLLEANAHRYHAVLDASAKIRALDIPSPNPALESPTAFADFETMQAYFWLKSYDLAMQAGERYMKDHPTGLWYVQVDQQMRAMIDTRKKQERAKSVVEAHFEELDREVADYTAKRDAARNDVQRHALDARLRNYDLERCWYPSTLDLELYEKSLGECQKYVARYGSEANPDEPAKQNLAQAQYRIIEDEAELGRFAEAQKDADAFLKAHPIVPGALDVYSEWSRHLQSEMVYWPVDD